MKFLVLFACAIAATSAGVITPLHYVHHEVPVVNTHGVPQDTVEVQHAKAAHYAAKSEAHVRNGDYVHTPASVVAASAVPVVSHINPQQIPVVSHYNTHVPVVSHVNTQYVPVVQNNNAQYIPVVNGVPQDTAEVQHAKAVHYAHKVEAHVRNGDYAYQTYSTPVVAAVSPVVVAQQTWTGEQHVPVINQNGVPEETVEVKQAKSDHFAAVKVAAPVVNTYVHTAPVVAPVVAAQPAWTGEQHVPIINNGVPEETVEVKQAKADHFAAVKDAEVHNVEEVVTGYEHNSPVVAQSVWTGEQHVPVITNGVPEETIEVKQAKANHFAAVKDAEIHNVEHHVETGYVHNTPVVAQAVWTGEQHVPVINQNGVPVETIEVQQAKSNHFAAVRVAGASYVHNTAVVAPVVAQPAWTGEQHVPVINNGVPEDTVEVKQAKADHFAAVKDAEVHNVEEHGVTGNVHNSQVVWTGEQHVPVINQNGVPVETAEVQQAKANHFAAVKVAGPTYVHSTHLVASVVAPVVAQPIWTGEQHVPVIANGVPEETVEVQQAKADHFAAVKDAEVHNVDNEKDVVTETPDVVAAKGAHFAAHVEARARSAPVDAYYTPYVAPYVNQYHGNYRYSAPYVQYY